MSDLAISAATREPVSIRRVAHRRFPSAGPYVRDERRLRHYRDLLAPYGVALDERMLERGGQNSFHSMGDMLVSQLEGLPAALDLAVIAHATPDFDPILSAASHLAHICPGEPRSFAISDHGVGAPFAALRVIAAHLRCPGYTHALLVVLDQTTLPNYDERVHAGPVDDSAVAVLIGPGGCGRVWGVARQAQVNVEDALTRATQIVRGMPETLLVAGPALADVADAEDLSVHVASARHLCTAVWFALSEQLESWRRQFRQLLLADYDPALGHLHTALIALSAEEWA
jgi:hypothetical protein